MPKINPETRQPYPVTDDDPICVCGEQKHDHFYGGEKHGLSASNPKCEGFKVDQHATDAQKERK